MNRTFRTLIRVAGAMTAAGGLTVAAMMPAEAAAPNLAYAAGATGLISVSPIGEATYPGTSPVSVADASIAGLLDTGVATATAGPTSASENIANVSATLSLVASLFADSVTSSCLFNTNTGTVSGSVTIANGEVSTPLGDITLDSNPTPNEGVTVPGIATITLNQQTTAGDGTLTVTAIYIALLGTTQTLSIGTSVCNAANLAPVPVLPGVAMPITLAGLGAMLLAVLVYQAGRRRRRATTVAAR
jgi:hypothetical protein